MKITLSKSQWELVGQNAGWIKKAQEYDYDTATHSTVPRDIIEPSREMPEALFKYYINLDERGSFYADVRDSSEKTVFTIKAGEEGETSIFTDGYMKHKYDLVGLKAYLVELGVMKPNQKLVRGN